MNGTIILKKNVAIGMMNQVMRLRLRKLAQWEALSVAITEHTSVTNRVSKILGLTAGVAMIVTAKSLLCENNMF